MVHDSVHRQILKRGYAAPVDVLMDIGVLSRKDYEAWRHGKVDYLERVCNMNLRRLSVVNKAIRTYARENGLRASFTGYTQWGITGRSPRLRFSKSGDPGIERNYATHYVDPRMATGKKAGKPSETSEERE